MHSVSSILKEDSLLPYLRVEGKSCLSGHVNISGAKNSALVLMAASLLCKETLVLNNIPKLTDIDVMTNILKSLGANIKRNKNKLQINASGLNGNQKELPYELVHALRASLVCIGPLLTRFEEVKIPLPGGCRIGARPIDEHINGLQALGVNVRIKDENIIAKITNPLRKLIGTKINFKCKSVGATETILMAATLAHGTTIIENAAEEPEIQDLANMLNKMGANIKGAGSSQINIEGVNRLHGCIHRVIPDRIEAGTFLIASAITRSPLTLSPVIPHHLESVISKLEEAGCLIEQSNEQVKIIPPQTINSVDITTMPYPGFPTDLQAPYMALMATARGTSKIKETIFEKRMQHVGELQRMGSKIQLQGNTAFVSGVKSLKATSLTGGDLRSSAAMVLASLSAQGISIVEGLSHLDRGYENFEDKLSSLGVNISRSMIKSPNRMKKNTKILEQPNIVSSDAEVA
ncbi:UDP-N-acetylglucosamine 1-carboxyvinyltransferase [Prochlorococcus marinus]|uniref:UDP-N-acetylglucosamine 1-carboxyvinyltransferase n=1 Tax=Prochlorococcus marinus TaxID=1219 RepID=UPI0022B317A0|nr:UDP-N-acetylglucosamine 1-carboxyvinyltransferase [Prochlorococcus marinus]